MANGSSHEGPARGDRIREIGHKHDRLLQKEIDAARSRDELPSYNDDGESEITGNWKQVNAKIPLPRSARIAIGFGLAALLFAGAIVAVLRAWPR